MQIRLRGISRYATHNLMVTDIPDRVRYALEHGETPYSLAKKAGLHRNTLYGCEADSWNPTLQTLNKLEPHLPKIPRRTH